MILKYARGMVFWATTPNHGNNHLVQGKRPVVIISNDIGNLFSSNVTILPCTSNVAKNQPTHVHTELTDKRGSVVMCETPMTIDKNDLEEYIGMLDTVTIHKIEESLKIALGLEEK